MAISSADTGLLDVQSSLHAKSVDSTIAGLLGSDNNAV